MTCYLVACTNAYGYTVIIRHYEATHAILQRDSLRREGYDAQITVVEVDRIEDAVALNA